MDNELDDLDIALAVSLFSEQVKRMPDEDVKKLLVQVYTQTIHQKNKYEQQIREQWGIESPRSL